jgi:hypothetical protein
LTQVLETVALPHAEKCATYLENMIDARKKFVARYQQPWSTRQEMNVLMAELQKRGEDLTTVLFGWDESDGATGHDRTEGVTILTWNEPFSAAIRGMLAMAGRKHRTYAVSEEGSKEKLCRT